MPKPDLLESTETDLSESHDLPWLVVVHNDPVNLMSYVAMVFRRIFGWTKERSERHMMEVHTKGRSVVWSGPREQGELFVQQLHSHLLLATLERSAK
jgi:ATP-dependent Clp protease adaptor protein ClpS